MSEQLYFFKFNKDSVRTKLLPLLKQEPGFSYKMFLVDHNSRTEKAVKFDTILRRIDENIEQLTEEELWSLFNWFYERLEKSAKEIDYLRWVEQLNEEMCLYGLDLFYEIPSKTPVRNFHNLFGDYEYLVKRDFEKSCDADELRGLLNYIICYSGELKIFLNRHYYKKNKNCEENLELQKHIGEINSTSGNHLHKLALAELEKCREYDLETIHLLAPYHKYIQANRDKPHYYLPEEFSEINERELALIDVAVMYEFASQIKEKLGNYDGKVTRLHSY